MSDSYDVICIGGAAIGSAVAYYLTENPDFDGTVAVIEPDPSYDLAQTSRAQNSIREQFSQPVNIAISQYGLDFIENFHENTQVEGESPELNYRGTFTTAPTTSRIGLSISRPTARQLPRLFLSRGVASPRATSSMLLVHGPS